MKYYYRFIVVASLIGLGYVCGRLHEGYYCIKDYQAACVLSDVCHYMMENIGNDAEEIYFDTIDNLDCDPGLCITRDEITKYNWSY